MHTYTLKLKQASRRAEVRVQILRSISHGSPPTPTELQFAAIGGIRASARQADQLRIR
jgi:hypothetical protein